MEKNDDRRKAKMILVIYLIAGIIIPIILKYVVFENPAKSLLSNDGWASFLGSYIGGALGGLGTLIAIYITVKQTIRIQVQNKEETDNKINAQNEEREREYNRDKADRDKEREDDYKRKKKENRQIFAEDIAGLIGKYITYISKYYYSSLQAERLEKEVNMAFDEYNKKDRQLRDINIKIENSNSLPQDTREHDIKRFKEEKNKIEFACDELKRRYEHKIIEKEENSKFGQRLEANEAYFIIKTKLADIVEGRNLIGFLEEFHRNVGMPKKIGGDNPISSWIDNNTTNLINEYTRFRKEYVGEQ